MRLARSSNVAIDASLFVTLVIAMTATRVEAVTVTHRYDIEASSGSVTESGWTHVQSSNAGSPTTFGFLTSPEGSRLEVNRVGSPPAPFDVNRDLILSLSGANAGASSASFADMIFRDIIPATALSVDVTIYRSDIQDVFAPNFITQTSIAGGALTTINSGLGTGGFVHPPILATISIPYSPTTTTLDFHFFDNAANSSQVRINGIQLIFTLAPVPEPSTFLLVGVGIIGLAIRRRRFDGDALQAS